MKTTVFYDTIRSYLCSALGFLIIFEVRLMDAIGQLIHTVILKQNTVSRKSKLEPRGELLEAPPKLLEHIFRLSTFDSAEA